MKWIIFFLLLLRGAVNAQPAALSTLPVTALPANVQDTTKPLVVYITGDGGLNDFSKAFVQQLNTLGYTVVAFNALKYFWSKKTPEQAAVDVETVISHYTQTFKKRRILFIGYSMGADVLPFIFTRLTVKVQPAIRQVVLMSPSNSTDFEVHATTWFSKTKGVSVPDEIDRVQRPMLIVQGEKESDKINTALLKQGHFKLLTLKGGHHYDSNIAEVTSQVLKNLQ